MTGAFALYGTSFENLDDEERDPVSKKPTAIQDQIATDDRGRRRFHGAFTGGFSAGFFNTVGSKQGWTPTEFCSTRDERADKSRQRAEDFMDSEDLGEFGIASRRIRQKDDFSSGPKLAWERGATADQSTQGLFAKDLELSVKAVSNSIGVRMLRAMGWRHGRAVGLATIKEAKASRGLSEVDREQITKIAPHWIASAEDQQVINLVPSEGVKGLGYDGQLKGEGLLNEKYGQTEAVLKGKKGRGITGQAFGVGAFEDEDESVYSAHDLSQYDFSIGPAAAEPDVLPAAPDSSFVVASSRLAPRKFFSAPRLPPNFRPDHKPRPLDPACLPPELQKAAANMTALQRSKFLGENRKELIIRSAKGTARKSRWDVKAEDVEEVDQEQVQRQYDREADRAKRIEFVDEPMKQARFKEFLNYVRRGLVMPQPRDLSHWEWEAEKGDFEERLMPEERALLPDVRLRSQPLAKTALALPIMDMMKSKFIGETNAPSQKNARDEDRMAAVKTEMFGEKTRHTWEWHPAHGIAKLFNVPNPFPGSGFTGLPHLVNKGKPKKDDVMTTIGLPNTAAEFAFRAGVGEERARESEREQRRKERDDRERKERDDERRSARQKKEQKQSDSDDDESEPEERPPDVFFSAIFELPSSSESEAEEEKKPEPAPVEPVFMPSENVVTVLDDDAEFGPAPPPGVDFDNGLTGFSVLRFSQEVLKKMKKRKRKSEREEHHKHAKRSKKSHKMKKDKKSKSDRKKRRRRSSSSSNSSDSSVQALD